MGSERSWAVRWDRYYIGQCLLFIFVPQHLYYLYKTKLSGIDQLRFEYCLPMDIMISDQGDHRLYSRTFELLGCSECSR